MKVKCNFDGELVECKVVENMGYQGGYVVKAVEHNNIERIVIKVGNIYRPKTSKEKIGLHSYYTGQ